MSEIKHKFLVDTCRLKVREYSKIINLNYIDLWSYTRVVYRVMFGYCLVIVHALFDQLRKSL